VVQIDYQASAVCDLVHLLEQPPIATNDENWPNWFATGYSSEFRQLRAFEKKIGREMRRIYTKFEEARVAGILETCRQWGVHLVVFPEYTIPPECLTGLLPLTKGMTVVFGTHAVERDVVERDFYKTLGNGSPSPGTSVAPIAIDGRIHRYQPKLNRSHLEVGMVCGTCWESTKIESPVAVSVGVLICLDHLKRDDDAYRNHVGEKIDACDILAVPSLTPSYTASEFDNQSIVDATRYGRVVLYANIAEAGNTSIHFDNGKAKGTEFPRNIPRLAKNEEGIVVADIDCCFTEKEGQRSRRYSEREAALPVAASLLRYATIQEDQSVVAELSAMLSNCDLESISSISAAVAVNAQRLAAIADQSSATIQHRLNVLLERHGKMQDPEHALRLLRDVILSDNAYPTKLVDDLRIEVAREMAKKFVSTSGGREPEQVEKLRRRLSEVCI
jgi:predicted amidohydrolase